MTTEIIFIVEEVPDDGQTAHAVRQSVFTQGDTPYQIRQHFREPVHCDVVDETGRPKVIQFCHVHDNLFAA